MTTLDGPSLRQAFAHVPSGVVAICAEVGGERIGMAASTFVPVSLDPPLVSFCVQNTSTTRDCRRSRTWHQRAQRGARRCRAGARREERRPLRRYRHREPRGRCLFVSGTSVRMDVTVEQEVPAGDHAIVVLRINELLTDADVEPIVFHRSSFRRLLAS